LGAPLAIFGDQRRGFGNGVVGCSSGGDDSALSGYKDGID